MGIFERRRRALERMSDISGTVLTAVGSALAAGAGSSALNTFATSERDGRWWFVSLFAVALVFLLAGIWLTRRVRRNTSIGIVGWVSDRRRVVEEGRRLVNSATRYADRAFGSWVLIPEMSLPADYREAAGVANAWGRQLVTVLDVAEAMAPKATRANLLIVCPLHVAFRVGELIGTAGHRVVVYSDRGTVGSGDYFPAVALRQAAEPVTRPLDVATPETLDTGSTSRAAVAIDLGGKGDGFFGSVRTACEEQDVGWLLRITNPSGRLAENQETFTGAVDTIAEACRKHTLPSGPSSRRFVFVNGPPAVVVGIGAVLKLGGWTPMAFEKDGGGRYVPFESAEYPAGERQDRTS